MRQGIDGVMEFFEVTLDAFDQVLQISERYFDLGDRVLVFVMTKVRAKASGIALDQPSAHLLSYKGGRLTRMDVFDDREQALEAAGCRSGRLRRRTWTTRGAPLSNGAVSVQANRCRQVSRSTLRNGDKLAIQAPTQ